MRGTRFGDFEIPFKTPEQLGPQRQFNPAPGIVTGKVTFRFLDSRP